MGELHLPHHDLIGARHFAEKALDLGEVLRLIATGLSNRKVAEGLYVSINTVKWHLKHIYEKLDVHSRVAADTRAREPGLL